MITLQHNLSFLSRCATIKNGRVAEWLMALVLKTSKLIASQVRILSLPPVKNNAPWVRFFYCRNKTLPTGQIFRTLPQSSKITLFAVFPKYYSSGDITVFTGFYPSFSLKMCYNKGIVVPQLSWLERRTHKPEVGGSIPPGTTTKYTHLGYFFYG